MEIFFILAMLAGAVATVMSNVPDGMLKLLAKPKELQAAIRTSRQLKEIEATRTRTDTMVVEHQKSLATLRESRQVEFDFFDYQLFNIDRAHIMETIPQRIHAAVKDGVVSADLVALEADVHALWKGFHDQPEATLLADPQIIDDMNTLVNTADAIKKIRKTEELAAYHARQTQKAIEAKKSQETLAEQQAIERGDVPYLASPVHILDYIEAVKADGVSIADQYVAIKRFLGAEWDNIAFYFDDDATVRRIMDKTTAKLERSTEVFGFEEIMRAEVVRRYEKSTDKKKLMEMYGME